jgi:hypothetical protein
LCKGLCGGSAERRNPLPCEALQLYKGNLLDVADDESLREPCQMVGPVVEEVASEYGDRLRVLTVVTLPGCISVLGRLVRP